MRKKIAGMLTLVLVMIAMIGCSMKNTAVGSNTEGEKASVTPSSAEGEKLSETPTPSEAAAELSGYGLSGEILIRYGRLIRPLILMTPT